MIKVFFGGNVYELEQAVRMAIAKFSGEIERIDGSVLEFSALQDLAMGETLFSKLRMVIVRDLSAQSDIWSNLSTVLERMSSDTQLILIERSIDKRTKTYKWLKKHASVEEFTPSTDRDKLKVISWCVEHAKSAHKFILTKDLATRLVERLGYDQLRLDQVLEQMSLAKNMTPELFDIMVPLPRMENVFDLFEAVLTGRRQQVHEIIAYLEQEGGADAAYQTFGLIVSQLVPLNALVLGGDAQAIARDFSTHPFVVQKLAPHARKLNLSQVKSINDSLIQADLAMKSTAVSPWLLLETALQSATTSS